MPKLGKKKYAYTKKGVAAYKAAKRKGKKMNESIRKRLLGLVAESSAARKALTGEILARRGGGVTGARQGTTPVFGQGVQQRGQVGRYTQQSRLRANPPAIGQDSTFKTSVMRTREKGWAKEAAEEAAKKKAEQGIGVGGQSAASIEQTRQENERRAAGSSTERRGKSREKGGGGELDIAAARLSQARLLSRTQTALAQAAGGENVTGSVLHARRNR